MQSLLVLPSKVSGPLTDYIKLRTVPRTSRKRSWIWHLRCRRAQDEEISVLDVLSVWVFGRGPASLVASPTPPISSRLRRRTRSSLCTSLPLAPRISFETRLQQKNSLQALRATSTQPWYKDSRLRKSLRFSALEATSRFQRCCNGL